MRLYLELRSLLKYFVLSPAPKNIKIKFYKTVILLVILNACETWSLTSREEHGLKVFENRLVKRIFGPKEQEMVVGWRKLRNEELHSLYRMPNIINEQIKEDDMGRAYSTHGRGGGEEEYI
jgi:hypothetical protein